MSRSRRRSYSPPARKRQLFWALFPVAFFVFAITRGMPGRQDESYWVEFDDQVDFDVQDTMKSFLDEQSALNRELSSDDMVQLFHIRFPPYKITSHSGPRHRDVIHIAPCEPVAVLVEDQVFLIDETRGPYQRISAKKLPDIPIISGLDVSSYVKNPKLNQMVVAIIEGYKLTNQCFGRLVQIHRDESRSFRVSFSNDHFVDVSESSQSSKSQFSAICEGRALDDAGDSRD